MVQEKIQESSPDDFDVTRIYTPLSVAKEEIWKRWNDKDLKKEVEKFLGNDIPEVFKGEPKMILFRNIATPNLELEIAVGYAKMMEIGLVVVEYTVDKFCTRNQDKLHFGKMMFFRHDDSSQVVSKENVISIQDDDGKVISDIETLWGENLVAFHHRIFKESGYADVETFDASVYKNAGMTPYEIYIRILGLCLRSAVLLENFLIKADKGERKFTHDVILPAFEKLQSEFGIQPLIVPLLAADGEGSIYWQYYSEEIRGYVAEEGRK